MPDAHTTITEQPRDIVDSIAAAMEIRAASPQQRAMLDAYLRRIKFPVESTVVEIGCGTGPVCETLAKHPNVSHVIGIDPSPVLIEKARRLRGFQPKLRFLVEDGQALSLGDGTADVVVIHTVLCHVPAPEAVLREAFRILRPQGLIAVFDGDYETITASVGPFDPLSACVESFKEGFINDLWIARRLPVLLQTAGFRVDLVESHGYLESDDPGYMLTVIDRGTDRLVSTGHIGSDLGTQLKQEARRRASEGRFFGHIAYLSLIAHRP